MKLSILIPTLANRANFRKRLMGMLAPQLSADIELLTDLDNGERKTGTKRNALIERATGDYVVFIDDDDRIAPEYIAELMAGISKGVDVVSIRGRYRLNGGKSSEFIDKPHRAWSRDADGNHLRGVQHLDAVKRSIALQAKFPEISFGEDKAWGERIEATGLVRTWHEVSKPIYFYDDRRPK